MKSKKPKPKPQGKPQSKPKTVKSGAKPKWVKPKRGPGCPTKFNEHIANQIFAYAAVGMTDDRIAAAVRITRQTLDNWKKVYPEFFDALKHAKEMADDMVEGALLHRAQGYSHPAIKVHFDKFGKCHIKEYMEHYPPSESAGIFWLKNRRRKNWKDTQGREFSGPNGGPMEFTPPQIVITLPSNGREASEGKKDGS